MYFSFPLSESFHQSFIFYFIFRDRKYKTLAIDVAPGKKIPLHAQCQGTALPQVLSITQHYISTAFFWNVQELG